VGPTIAGVVCARSGRTSDHLREEDAQVEMDVFPCEIRQHVYVATENDIPSGERILAAFDAFLDNGRLQVRTCSPSVWLSWCIGNENIVFATPALASPRLVVSRLKPALVAHTYVWRRHTRIARSSFQGKP
jgi:hypothetical protein